MVIWNRSRWDGLLLTYSVGQLVVMAWSVSYWETATLAGRAGLVVLLMLLMAYNIIVVSHLFTHVPWFVSPRLNAAVSVLNSVNIGQSVQAYELTHVRNHHRYNNDRPGPDGTTRDASSTYRGGKGGEHAPVGRYVVGSAIESLCGRARELTYVDRLWRVDQRDGNLLALAAKREPRRAQELRQVRVDRAAHCLWLVSMVAVSWQWTVLCYLPAFFGALSLVNVQNYYRHYGADPTRRAADSVSHYGRLYNLIAFNDGYHQEHHLSPATHWSQLPGVRERHRDRLNAQPRIVSPVPAVVGFLHHSRRPLLHRLAGQGPATFPHRQDMSQ